MNLEDYIAKEGLGLREIAPKLGVSYSALWKATHGYDMMLSTAAQLVKASKGKIKFHHLIQFRKDYLSKNASRAKDKE